MSSVRIPMPPLELLRLVGPGDAEAFDNPGGQPIYKDFGLPIEAYNSVFDFGCGCGRFARQLLQQNPRPGRYVGIDVHRGMIDWCKQNLTPIDSNFHFFHHDVYAPGYAPGNSLRLAEPFPVPDGESSLVIVNSVFTHLYRRQTEYYLREVARILNPSGAALTSWFFFDRKSFPFLREGPFCLFAGEINPLMGVIYDRGWFIDAVRISGLGVRSTKPPAEAGHQWYVLLEKRKPNMVDQFPLGEDGAEWLCGATSKPIAISANPPEVSEKHKVDSPDSKSVTEWPQPPALFGELAEIYKIKHSWTWRIGRAVTGPVHVFKRIFLP